MGCDESSRDVETTWHTCEWCGCRFKIIERFPWYCTGVGHKKGDGDCIKYLAKKIEALENRK